MGLDMYLSKRHYVQRWDHIKPERQYLVTVTQGGVARDDIKSDRVTYVIEQVAYWRKANQIHKWFVVNVQDGNDDCRHYPVQRTQLEELLALVRRVSANHDLARDELPTESGFFFGNTKYDAYYFSDLDETERMLSAILAEPDPDYAAFEYRASW